MIAGFQTLYHFAKGQQRGVFNRYEVLSSGTVVVQFFSQPTSASWGNLDETILVAQDSLHQPHCLMNPCENASLLSSEAYRSQRSHTRFASREDIEKGQSGLPSLQLEEFWNIVG
jgi:hypothetical protein